MSRDGRLLNHASLANEVQPLQLQLGTQLDWQALAHVHKQMSVDSRSASWTCNECSLINRICAGSVKLCTTILKDQEDASMSS